MNPFKGRHFQRDIILKRAIALYERLGYEELHYFQMIKDL